MCVFEYIKIDFRIYAQYIKVILQVYQRFIIPTKIIIVIINIITS
jgi:hypothetical protein